MPSPAANAQGPYPVQVGEKIAFLFDFTPALKDPTTGLITDHITGTSETHTTGLTVTIVGTFTQTTVTYLIDFSGGSVVAGTYWVSIVAVTATSPAAQWIFTEEFTVTARTPV